MKPQSYVLGSGMTGLAAGMTSGFPIYEALEVPGGICCSYYIRPGDDRRFYSAPKDGEAYRFEVGGGHWIFGGDPLVLRFIRSLVPVKTYTRKSSVFLPDREIFIPYPIQNHLRYLGLELAAKVLDEIVEAAMTNQPISTMADWLKACFGPTLCALFFYPFHELYTAGLYKQIAPQDIYKSPVNIKLAIKGAFTKVSPVGYNVSFIYPEEGLNTLVYQMAARCNVHYCKRVMRIEVKEKILYFDDGSSVGYETLLSTLPLNKMVEMAGLSIDEQPDPATSVLVVNIGAKRGRRCPDEYWVYIPNSRAGFYRVGFYSNVDLSFLPTSFRNTRDRVSIYVEKAYPEGQKPSEREIKILCDNIIQELQEWDWIEEAEVVDPTWIDVAYTWTWPNSRWREKVLKALERYDIYQIGRYGRWAFQGITDSIRDGLMAGGALK